MKLRLFTAGILLPGMIFAGSAEDTDLSGYTGAETETSLESIVANGGFERGADGWILKKDCRIEKNGGRNGTAALRYERRNPKEYQLGIRPMKAEDIIEVDNFSELVALDASYADYAEREENEQ